MEKLSDPDIPRVPCGSPPPWLPRWYPDYPDPHRPRKDGLYPLGIILVEFNFGPQMGQLPELTSGISFIADGEGPQVVPEREMLMIFLSLVFLLHF